MQMAPFETEADLVENPVNFYSLVSYPPSALLCAHSVIRPYPSAQSGVLPKASHLQTGALV